jgi:small conductance mechanosensitive channel
LAALVAMAVLASSTPLAAAPPEAEPTTPILLDAGPEADQAIERRLAAIYAEFDSLRAIEVEVSAGVVHLSGDVHSLEAVREAESIAKRVEAVVAVTNDIQQNTEVQRRLQPIFEQMRERVSGWLTYLPLVLVAVGVIALAWWLTRVQARRSQRRDSSTPARQLVDQLVRAGILVIGVAIALELLGARGLLGGLLGTAGVIGIVLGIALRNIGETYFASVLLRLHPPFDPHDYVRIEDSEGSVVRLTSRTTELMTIDGNLVWIPNAKVFGATVINFTRNPHRRFAFKLGVGVGVELRRVQDLATATLATVPGVLAEPGPACFIDEFGESAMVVSVAGWVDQRKSDWLKVSSEAKRMIKAAFDEAGIAKPEPSFRIQTTTASPHEARPVDEREPGPSPDISPDRHIVRQVDEERASGRENDLLREDGRSE